MDIFTSIGMDVVTYGVVYAGQNSLKSIATISLEYITMHHLFNHINIYRSLECV